MSKESFYPSIKLDIKADPILPGGRFHIEAMERIIGWILPPNFFQGEDVEARFAAHMPIVCWTPIKDPPCEISFLLCCKFRPTAFRFFYEMVSRWLIPGKRLNALLQFAVDFTIPTWGDQKYIGGEVMVRIDSLHELEVLQKNLPIIESEIRMGLESAYHASRILEIKGLTSDEKTALIQENIVLLIKHRPQDFDYDILSEMQHFLVLCKEGFKSARTFRHMSRIICVHYLFRKALRFSLEVYPDKRMISAKLIRACLQGQKQVLGIALGISFIRNTEVFEARHMMGGIQAILPLAEKVEGSFFSNHSRSDPTCTLYLEIEKQNGETFTLEEERLLKEFLPLELKNRIEQRLNPIFMPENEEEVMRHILTLSDQLRYVRDLPQVIITFNLQTEDELEFLVVALRVAKPDLMSIEECFDTKPTFLTFIPDRIKNVGTIRKKYRKEASVFRLRIRKLPFLRRDHSVDLYKARQEVSSELARMIGEFRDFNGGTISKESELFEKLHLELGQLAQEHAFVLENFFYSLNPPVMRSVLPVYPLKKIFTMLIEIEASTVLDELQYQIHIREDEQYLFLLLIAYDNSFKENLLSSIGDLALPAFQLTTCFISHGEHPIFVLIYRDPQSDEARILRRTIENVMNDWASRSLSLAK